MRVFQRDRKLNISTAYLTPGFAFGGSCLPKDVKALVGASRHFDLPAPVLSAILPSNDAQVRRGIDARMARRDGTVVYNCTGATLVELMPPDTPERCHG